jgi:hypothetical protein
MYKKLPFVLIFVYLFIPSSVFAADTCCVGHGGDNYCNTATSQLYCKDGHVSTQCTCHATPTATPMPTAIPTNTPAPSSPSCPQNASFSESDSACLCTPGYVVSNNACVTDTAYCQAQYGNNAVFDMGSNACACSSGYTWNSDGTACVTMDALCNEKLGSQSYYNSTNNQCYCYDGYSIQNDQCQVIPTQESNTPTTGEQIVPVTSVPIPTLARVISPTRVPTKDPVKKAVPTINLKKKVPGLDGFVAVKKKQNGFFADLLSTLWDAFKKAFNI